MKQPSEYYDQDFIKSGKSYYSTGHYAERNRLLIERLKNYNIQNVIEIAGAEGHIAYLLLKSKKINRYYFTDFSQQALEIAYEKNKDYQGYVSCILDADNDEIDRIPWHDYDMFICTSSEHFYNDRYIISKLKKGTLIYLSLPNFLCKGHIRSFRSIEQVKDRYNDLLTIDSMWITENKTQRVISYTFRKWLGNHADRMELLSNLLGVEIIGNKMKFNIIGYKK